MDLLGDEDEPPSGAGGWRLRRATGGRSRDDSDDYLLVMITVGSGLSRTRPNTPRGTWSSLGKHENS